MYYRVFLADFIFPTLLFCTQGEDLGPLELKIDTLQKQILESLEQCTQMQQFWLRQQNDLVRKTRQADEQTQSVDSLKKQLLILDQKKLRTDGKGHQELITSTRCS